MTEVTFFEDFHCFEYHTPLGAAPRFRYFLFTPAYERLPFYSRLATPGRPWVGPAVYSSEFIPARLRRRRDEG